MAHKAFDGNGIADAALRARFEKNVQAFLSLAEAAKHYPCMKRAWIEFLGEPVVFHCSAEELGGSEIRSIV